MLKKGNRVQELTKKVGQIGRHGKVVDVRDDLIEVKWDDGHTSIVSHGLLVREKKDD